MMILDHYCSKCHAKLDADWSNMDDGQGVIYVPPCQCVKNKGVPTEKLIMEQEAYMGDSVYAGTARGMLWVWTWNGDERENMIALEPEVYKQLTAFVKTTGVFNEHR